MSDDTIYRQAAIDTVRRCPVKEVTPAYMLIDKVEIMTELMMLPSAEPVRMKGKWSVTPDGRLVCSCCYKNPTNRIIVNGNLIYDMTPIRKLMKFCPNCGCDMREGGWNEPT